MYELGKLDKLSFISIKYGKTIAFLLMLVFLAAVIIGAADYFTEGPKPFRTPVYEDYKPYLGITGERAVQQDFSEIDTRIDIERNYGAEIKNILVLGNFDQEFFQTLVDWLVRVPDNRRSRFLYGLEDFLDGYAEALNQDATINPTPEERTELFLRMATTYKSIFYELVDKEDRSRAQSAQHQTATLLFIGIALLLFLVALIFPVVLKIEENSRLFR